MLHVFLFRKKKIQQLKDLTMVSLIVEDSVPHARLQVRGWLCSSVNWRSEANWHTLSSFLGTPPPPEGGPPQTHSLTHSRFQLLTQTLTTSQSAQNTFPAISASNQLQKKVQGRFLETDWFSAHGAHLPELDVLWVMQIFLTNELHSTPP